VKVAVPEFAAVASAEKVVVPPPFNV